MKFLQSRNFLMIAITVLVLLILAGGAWFVMGSSKTSSSSDQTINSGDQQMTVGTLTPGDIGLKMELSPDSKKVRFTADKLDGVKSLEWNFTYDADIPAADRTPDNEGQKVTQQFGSDQPVLLNGKTTYQSDFRELGTCSSGHCRYDTGVVKVDLELKVTKQDGKVYKVDDSINL